MSLKTDNLKSINARILPDCILSGLRMKQSSHSRRSSGADNEALPSDLHVGEEVIRPVESSRAVLNVLQGAAMTGKEKGLSRKLM